MTAVLLGACSSIDEIQRNTLSLEEIASGLETGRPAVSSALHSRTSVRKLFMRSGRLDLILPPRRISKRTQGLDNIKRSR